MSRPCPFPSTLLICTALLCAAPARSQETDLVRLQQQMSERALVRQVTSILMGAVNDSNKTVAGNVAGSGAGTGAGRSTVGSLGTVRLPAPASGSASASARTREATLPARSLPVTRPPAGQALSSLDLQPLPPVERGRRGAPR